MSHLQALNEYQQRAVTTVDGPLLIIAGPGSGKTRVITHRIAHMVSDCGIAPYEIAALTFTNKAADEMRTRIERMVPDSYVWTGTFHRFCSRLLRKHATLAGLEENFSIYDSSDSLRLVKQAMEAVHPKDIRYRAESIANEISRAKSACIDAENYGRFALNALQTVTTPVYEVYQSLLSSSNAADFDDLLLHVVTILKNSPDLRQELDEHFRYILVDEYQDTNLAQYAIVRALSIDHPNLAVTGDPDQSVYSWRGANIKNILEFEKDFPNAQIVRLEDNYRSTKSILRVADQLIANNRQRKHKVLRTENVEGDPVRLVAFPDQQTEAQSIAEELSLWLKDNIYQPDEIAIFYRANWLSRSIEHALRTAGIPYQIVNGYEFYQRREIKDLLAYLHLLNNPSDSVAFERVINVPPRKIGKITVQRLKEFAAENRISLFEAARQSGLIDTIKKGAATKVAGFCALYDKIAIDATESVERLLQTIIDETKYIDYLVAEDTPEAHERAGNVEELLLAAREFDIAHPDDGGLEAYLEQTSLVNDVDAWDSANAAVTLMTLHAAKGLEFPVVFMVGLEEGLLPHERSSVDEEEVEEERRLMFVGITRAQQKLNLSRCMTRFRRGRVWPIIPSRFLMELPRSEMEISEPPNTHYANLVDGSRGAADVWNEHEMAQEILQSQDEDDVPFAMDDLVEQENSPQAKKTSAAKSSPDSSLPAEKPEAFNLVSAAEMLAGNGNNPQPSGLNLSAGQFVFHPTYGRGHVDHVEGSGKKQLATISFESVGEKKIKPAFSNLVIIGR